MSRIRNSDRLRTRIYWMLVAAAITPMLVALLFYGAEWLVAAAAATVLVSLLLAIPASGYLIAPVHELARRLNASNNGEADEGSESTRPLDLNEGGLDVAAKLSQSYVDWLGLRGKPLPFELMSIERLARSGRVSEIALESVKKDLFRHLSHQLKSPMALLRAHADTIRTKCTGAPQLEGIEPNLVAIDDIAMSVSSLVETMLSMAWAEGLGDRGPLKSKVNLSATLMQTVSIRNSIPSERGITLETDVEAGLWVRGERDLLREMFNALIDNAMRYSPEGSTVMVEAKRVFATKTILIKVVDQGCGIPPSERERVFEPFYGSTGMDENGIVTYGTRRHRPLASGLVKSSHGLGLSLVKQVAKLHGAQIALNSGPGGVGLSVDILIGSTTPQLPNT